MKPIKSKSPNPDQFVNASAIVNTTGIAPNTKKKKKYGEMARYCGSAFLMRVPSGRGWGLLISVTSP
ncbi:Uncharacterised protein [Mycobacteroides abscessus subsp. abscessus]|nr:Uncharacterised protein [Mycobacteroides abscessus subsp. abscessus]